MCSVGKKKFRWSELEEERKGSSWIKEDDVVWRNQCWVVAIWEWSYKERECFLYLSNDQPRWDVGVTAMPIMDSQSWVRVNGNEYSAISIFLTNANARTLRYETIRSGLWVLRCRSQGRKSLNELVNKGSAAGDVFKLLGVHTLRWCQESLKIPDASQFRILSLW